MCHVLSVSRSCYYVYRKDGYRVKSFSEKKIEAQVIDAFTLHMRRYGVRRLVPELLDQGLKIGMNELLKKDLEKLLEAHPELKNRKLVFTDDDILFATDAEKAAAGAASAKAPCKIREEFPAVIKGHSLKIEVRKSPVHGYGVFAKEDIAEGEFIEKCLCTIPYVV